jgi:hypothetical protein
MPDASRPTPAPPLLPAQEPKYEKKDSYYKPEYKEEAKYGYDKYEKKAEYKPEYKPEYKEEVSPVCICSADSSSCSLKELLVNKIPVLCVWVKHAARLFCLPASVSSHSVVCAVRFACSSHSVVC